MKNIHNILLVLLVSMDMAKTEVGEDIEDIFKEMMAVEIKETNAKIVTLEEEMKARVDTFERDMKNMKSKHDSLKREVQTKDDTIILLENKMRDMNYTFDKKLKRMSDTFEKELKTKDDSVNKLVREVSFLKDPPYTFFCAYTAGTSLSSQTITYDKLLYSSSNIPDTTMDTYTGIFTSGWGGTYTVTWSLFADVDTGDSSVHIYLRKNGEVITESRHDSYYSGAGGEVREQGGRTLLVHLGRGDTLDLWCEDCRTIVYSITFCITMSGYDHEYK